jgi:protease-4
MLQDIIDKLYARFVNVVYENRQKLLSMQEVDTLADGRILTAGDALDAKLIDQVAYLDETVSVMKKALNIEQAKVITYIRPKTFKSNIYSEIPLQVPSVMNLISINAEEISFLSGVQFMYLWNP